MKKTEKSLNKKNINYVAVLLVIYDIIAVNLAYFLALWFRFDCKYSMVESSGYLDNFLKFVPIYSAFCILVFLLHTFPVRCTPGRYTELCVPHQPRRSS